jgi:hypothetical protein
MDQVVVLLIGLPPSTPNPCSAQIRPNTVRINPNVNVATKVVLIQGSYARLVTPVVPYTDSIEERLEDGTELELLQSADDFAERLQRQQPLAQAPL